MALAAGGLVGCSTLNAVNPISWYHNLEGGAIARQRPPPPNVNAPYPSLGSVPDRPVGSDVATRAGIADSLVTDRSNAQYAAEAAPVPPPAAIPAPSPAPAASTDGSNATLAAASAAPAPPVLAPPVVTSPVPTSPPPALPSVSPDSATPGPGTDAVAEPEAAIPDSPPPPPSLPGVIATTRPTAPPKRPPATIAIATPVAGAPLPIAFPSGSAILPPEAVAALQALAHQRGGGAVDVVGFGEARDTAPAAQAAALPLALARARSVLQSLVAAGVPPADVRIEAEASGTGAAARIIR